ncbi:MAG TPA: NAD(P)-dependent alcohol dehydrogenase [Verrucomicrobiae bacterium]|jgi:NADPH:quinone reductase-like Zn-dependent oxidoreductase|nr:NAD(P)-dependent alcohol dehydrogenase [Verrucomicrobiae bacterium]
MRAIRLNSIGGPENLALETLPPLQPAPGEVLVRIRAAALNHRDVFITQGLYPNVALPRTLGSDGAGEVAGLGDGVDGPAVGSACVINPMLDWGDDPAVWGDRASILGMPRDGTFAQYVSVPAENVFAKPAGLSIEEAAAIPLAGLTAYRALFTRGGLREGETVLITGVGGGVQTFALLFAKRAGARVIATSSSDEKLARAREMGADVTINYRQDEAWFKTARAAGPIDLAIDSSGGASLARAVGAVRPGGRAIIYGGTTGDVTLRPFSLFWHHVDLRGTSMGSPQDFRAMLALFEADLKPAIDRVFPMSEIVPAAQRMLAAHQFGKIVITVD